MDICKGQESVWIADVEIVQSVLYCDQGGHFFALQLLHPSVFARYVKERPSAPGNPRFYTVQDQTVRFFPPSPIDTELKVYYYAALQEA